MWGESKEFEGIAFLQRVLGMRGLVRVSVGWGLRSFRICVVAGACGRTVAAPAAGDSDRNFRDSKKIGQADRRFLVELVVVMPEKGAFYIPR